MGALYILAFALVVGGLALGTSTALSASVRWVLS
ncbi:hypothetical protein UFOVP1339_9 [uncultured Caudovirales phage]|uniref:Uncharacterized protein n=1 Tax=uncultured Caudovirales phage TaxID=2100421 RepID=A0A6J5RQW1_9CAUD|nr:hypothetical protein UFOVP1339_9 [uncultured Caudovirales phage]